MLNLISAILEVVMIIISGVTALSLAILKLFLLIIECFLALAGIKVKL